jgi:uncharacterized protein (TIGR03066 family)
MRTLLGMSLVLVLAFGVSAADEKIDAKKLVGKWEMTGEKKKAKFTVEFTADGKLHLTGTLSDGKEFTLDGTYKVDGNKIIQTLKIMDKEQMLTVTVTEFTDDEMEGEVDKGEKAIFKKIKTEKKDK